MGYSSLRFHLLVLCAFFLISTSVGFGQDTTTSRVYSVSLATGSILKNYPSFPDRGLMALGSASLGWQTYGHSAWQQDFRYPVLGLNIVAGSTGNQHVLGNLLAVMPYLSWSSGDLWKKELKVGLGFAWYTKHFDALTNTDNTLIGSHLTNITMVEFGLSRRISSALALRFAFGFSHFSNGHTRLPNLGINSPIASLGIVLKEPERGRCILHLDTLRSRFRILLEAGIGYHEFGESTEPVNGPLYKIYSVSSGVNFRASRLHNFYLLLTGSYYSSFRGFIERTDLFRDHQMINSSTLVLYLGHEFMAGHFSIDTRVGAYLFNPFRRRYTKEILDQGYDGRIYNSNKLGVNYYLFNTKKERGNLRLGLYIKANMGQADFVEWQIGWLL